MNKLSNRFLFLLLVVFSGLYISNFFITEQSLVKDVVQNQLVKVQAGDTVWGVAERFAGKNEDVRLVVDRIYKANQLSGETAIRPGQQLVVPVSHDFTETRMAAAGNRI